MITTEEAPFISELPLFRITIFHQTTTRWLSRNNFVPWGLWTTESNLSSRRNRSMLNMVYTHFNWKLKWYQGVPWNDSQIHKSHTSKVNWRPDRHCPQVWSIQVYIYTLYSNSGGILEGTQPAIVIIWKSYQKPRERLLVTHGQHVVCVLVVMMWPAMIIYIKLNVLFRQRARQANCNQSRLYIL